MNITYGSCDVLQLSCILQAINPHSSHAFALLWNHSIPIYLSSKFCLRQAQSRLFSESTRFLDVVGRQQMPSRRIIDWSPAPKNRRSALQAWDPKLSNARVRQTIAPVICDGQQSAGTARREAARARLFSSLTSHDDPHLGYRRSFAPAAK